MPRAISSLELTVNRGREVPYALGDGYGHLAVSVADVDAEHQRFIEVGLSPGKIIEADYKGQPFAKYFSSAIPMVTRSKCCSAATGSNKL